MFVIIFTVYFSHIDPRLVLIPVCPVYVRNDSNDPEIKSNKQERQDPGYLDDRQVRYCVEIKSFGLQGSGLIRQVVVKQRWPLGQVLL